MSIHSFHFFGAIGFFLGLMVGIGLAYATNLDIWPVVLCGLTGAGVLFGLSYLYKIITGTDQLVYYQHEIAILICCFLLLYFLRLPVIKYIDITLIGIGIFLAFGRIGCFSVGCCHGRIGKIGVKYSQTHVKEGFHQHLVGIPIFPIQLLESFCVLVTVVICSYSILKGFSPGTAFLIYTIIYGTVRFFLEYFRGDTERPYWQGFSEAQWTTLGIFAVSVILSLFNLLPHYTWHLWVLPGLLLWMLISEVIRKIRNDITFRLLNPKHVLEIAQGLEMLENNAAQLGQIAIVKTSTDLNISAGKTIFEQGLAFHYTVSFDVNNKDFPGAYNKSYLIMNITTANVLGKLIKTLNRLDEPFEILSEQSGVFHIVFLKTNGKAHQGNNPSDIMKLQQGYFEAMGVNND